MGTGLRRANLLRYSYAETLSVSPSAIAQWSASPRFQAQVVSIPQSVRKDVTSHAAADPMAQVQSEQLEPWLEPLSGCTLVDFTGLRATNNQEAVRITGPIRSDRQKVTALIAAKAVSPVEAARFVTKHWVCSIVWTCWVVSTLIIHSYVARVLT